MSNTNALCCVQPRDVETLLCQKAARLYDFQETPVTLAELFAALEDVKGIHVWILDDLTSLRPGHPEEAHRLAQALADQVRVSALPMQLVLSARFAGPLGWPGIHVQPLNPTEVADLARMVKQRANQEFKGDDWFGALHLFSRCGGSTAHFKRGLLLAAERKISFQAYVKELEAEGSLENLAAGELSRRMIEHERRQLEALQPEHGFAYAEFLRLFYPLISRAGHFNFAELQQWFGNRFHIPSSRAACPTAYENGLAYLTRLGLLAIRQTGGQTVFFMPPNQRLLIRELKDPTVALPEEIPFRAPKARLSQALEGARKGSLIAVTELLQMEQEYLADVAREEAAEAVAVGMLVGAELAGWTDPDEEIHIYDDLVKMFADRPETPLAEKVASALFNKGVRLGSLNWSEEAVVSFLAVIERYGNRQEPFFVQLVARIRNFLPE